MPISTTNANPRSLGYLNSILSVDGEKFVMMDIGARDGVVPHWTPIESMARMIGFEPDVAECDRLNRRDSGVEFVPFALSFGPEKRPFYLTELDLCHGFKKSNEEFLGRFPNAINNAVKDQIEMETDSLDNIVGKLKIKHIDFIKIDTEGSELEVLQGARRTLNNCSSLGLLVEVWWDPRLKNQPAFSDLDSFIREQGFTFFDIECQRYPRNTLPVGNLKLSPPSIPSRNPIRRWVSKLKGSIEGNPRYSSDPPYCKYGQMLTGDALYFRDPV